MAEIIMPKMGDAMTEGKVIRWYKKAGDSVTKGEPVLEIETDKVNLDLEAEEDGVISEIVAEEGAVVEVGKPLAMLGGDGAPAGGKKEKAAKPAKQKEPAKEEPADEEPAGEEEPGKEKQPAKAKAKPVPEPVEASEAKPEPKAKAEPRGEDRRVPSSPLARKIAREMGVEIGGISGSGPAGRVIAADVRRAAEGGGRPAAARAAPSAPAAAKAALPAAQPLEDKRVPLSAMRKTIALRLGESLGPIPHFFLTIEADVTELQKAREQLAEISGAKISINDFVIHAAALALHHHPNVNASFHADAIQLHGGAHIGIAVATPEGLITPVIRDADRKSVVDIAAEVREMAGRARNRKLRPDEYQGSTFTISNLGMYGIEEFTAVINPPNAAILAVGAAMEKPVVVNRRIRIRERMKVTMSCDHRAIDGAAGAEYLRTLQVYLEQPLRMIVS